MSTLPLIIAGIALFIILAAVAIIGISRRLTAKGKALIEARFRPEQIVLADPLANFFGLESAGPMQLRGNGALVLTHEILWFSQFVTDRELIISRESLLGVKSVGGHLGKTVGRGLLHLRFQGPTGEDAVAFYVRDLDGWLQALQTPWTGSAA